jgi:hypothetical protein
MKILFLLVFVRGGANSCQRLFELARPFSSPHNPVDAAANEERRKASTHERAGGTLNLPFAVAVVALGPRWNHAQCQQQSHWNYK